VTDDTLLVNIDAPFVWWFTDVSLADDAAVVVAHDD
jgi:hypothetical protein